MAGCWGCCWRRASRRIDGYCDRSFAAVHAERRFDGTGRAALAVPDLIAVAALRVRGAAGGMGPTGRRVIGCPTP